jgi:hypothetical protein
MPTHDPATRDHKAWLGYVQQEGLVVSPAALVDAQVVLDRNTLPMQEQFLPFVKEATPKGEDPVPAITDFPAFARGFLQWQDDCLHDLARSACAKGDTAQAGMWECKRDAVRPELERRAQGPGGLPPQFAQAIQQLSIACAQAGFADAQPQELGPAEESALAQLEKLPSPLPDLAAFLRRLAVRELPTVPSTLPPELQQFLQQLLDAVKEAGPGP